MHFRERFTSELCALLIAFFTRNSAVVVAYGDAELVARLESSKTLEAFVRSRMPVRET